MFTVEVDQSGKIEQTRNATSLAFANGMRYSLLIVPRAKRRVLGVLEQHYPAWSRTKRHVLVFATLLYLLLKEHIDSLDHADVDVEYEGHESIIKEHLLNLFHRRGVDLPADAIGFRQVGRHSPAHELAIEVHRGSIPPDKVVSADDVLGEFRL